MITICNQHQTLVQLNKGALDKLKYNNTSSPNFFQNIWDFYIIRSVGIGNDFMLSFTF